MFRKNIRRHASLALAAVGLMGLWLCGCAGGWSPGGGRAGYQAGLLPIDIIVTSRVDSIGADLPEVRIDVPYRSLIFQRRDDLFVAGVRVTVVASAKGQRVGGGVGSAEAVVAAYEQTRAKRRLTCRVPIELQDERLVRLDVTVEVVDSSREWTQRLEWRPQDARAVPLYFAGFEWNLHDEPEGDRILGITLDSLKVRLPLRQRPRAEEWPAGGVFLLARIQPSMGKESQSHRLPIAPGDVGADGMNVNLNWSAEELEFGKATLSVALESVRATGADRISLEPSRHFINLQVPWWNQEQWRHHVDWLQGALEPEARRNLLAIPQRERLVAWREAWRRIGADRGRPALELETTHMLRVVEADEKFGVFGRGALTDRGRVFIRYGPADTIENYGDDLSGPRRWEVWYYLQERLRFTFHDASGLGDFRLYERSSF